MRYTKVMDGATFEYLVCTAQHGHVMTEGDAWLGTLAQDSDHSRRRLVESCPSKQDYLNERGAEGWELVAVEATTMANAEVLSRLYLKRRRA